MDIEFKQTGLARINDYLDRVPAKYHPIYLSSFVVEVGSRIAVPPTKANETEILKKLNSALSDRISENTMEETFSLLQDNRRERLIEYRKALFAPAKNKGIIESIKTLFKHER